MLAPPPNHRRRHRRRHHHHHQQVDTNNNESISFDEWIDFWNNVLSTGIYTEEDVLEELDAMLKGGSWVDWNDGRSTGS